ncbi:MAG: YIP1 family protein [Defluviitaleaceae bacterium]|nr:YIP1 family protein [Defluviitaleaceae bacterium]
MRTLGADLKFLLFTIFHPFEGFYELRFRRKRNWPLIVVLLLMVGIVEILGFYHIGMIARMSRGFYINPLFAITTSVFPFVLFAVSNWSVTTLFDGNGKLGDVFMVMAYALAPKIVLDLAFIGLSNIVTIPELALLYAMVAAGYGIFVFLLFCGLCVAHEYNPAKCIVTILATIVSAVILVFIGAVYLILMGRLFGLITTVIAEITRRGLF